MTADADRYDILLEHAEQRRRIAASVPTQDAADLCGRTAVEFQRLADAVSPYLIRL